MLAGRSVSVAQLVRTNALSSLMVWSAGTVTTGARFTSFTITVKLLLSLNGGVPLSVTLIAIRFVLGPWASVGVQVNKPLLESRLTPLGAETRLKVSVLADRFASVAELVTTSVLSSSIVWLGGTVSTGAVFVPVTNTVKLLLSLNAGVPLSVTWTVIRFVLGPCFLFGVQVSTPLIGSTFTPAGPDTKL